MGEHRDDSPAARRGRRTDAWTVALTVMMILAGLATIWHLATLRWGGDTSPWLSYVGAPVLIASYGLTARLDRTR